MGLYKSGGQVIASASTFYIQSLALRRATKETVCVHVSDMSSPATDLQAREKMITLPDVQMAHWPE